MAEHARGSLLGGGSRGRSRRGAAVRRQTRAEGPRACEEEQRREGGSTIKRRVETCCDAASEGESLETDDGALLLGCEKSGEHA
jgi:hypothetical protein